MRTPAVGDDGIDWDKEALRVSKNPYPGKAGASFDYFKDLVKPHDRVLDLGCNIASCIGAWLEIEPTIRYDGLDLSKVAIDIARERYPDSEFYFMDAKDMDFNERYDIIFTHTFYQHVNRSSKGIIVPKVYRALKLGGLHVVQENTSYSNKTGMFKDEYIALFERVGFKLLRTHDIGGGGTGFVFKKLDQ